MVFAEPNWSLAKLGVVHASVLLLNGDHELVLLPYATAMKNAIPGSRLGNCEGKRTGVAAGESSEANPIMLTFLRQ